MKHPRVFKYTFEWIVAYKKNSYLVFKNTEHIFSSEMKPGVFKYIFDSLESSKDRWAHTSNFCSGQINPILYELLSVFVNFLTCAGDVSDMITMSKLAYNRNVSPFIFDYNI